MNAHNKMPVMQKKNKITIWGVCLIFISVFGSLHAEDLSQKLDFDIPASKLNCDWEVNYVPTYVANEEGKMTTIFYEFHGKVENPDFSGIVGFGFKIYEENMRDIAMEIPVFYRLSEDKKKIHFKGLNMSAKKLENAYLYVEIENSGSKEREEVLLEKFTQNKHNKR